MDWVLLILADRDWFTLLIRSSTVSKSIQAETFSLKSVRSRRHDRYSTLAADGPLAATRLTPMTLSQHGNPPKNARHRDEVHERALHPIP